MSGRGLAFCPSDNGHMAGPMDEARLVNSEDVLLLGERCSHHLVHELHCLHRRAVQELQTTTFCVKTFR